MPAKIDARSFNYAKLADSFLSLSADDTPRSSPVPVDSPDSPSCDPTQGLWKDITTNPDAVSSYIICLMAKLISLDSGQGTRPLPEVYKEITELQVDISKYKTWCNKEKPLSTAMKSKAVRLQQMIIATIFFLKQFYGFSANIQLRHMFLRWNMARNQIASPFEVEVLSSFSAAGSKDVRDLPVSTPFLSSEINEERLVRELINDCFHHQRRSFFGSLPSETCKLTSSQAVSTSLSYVRLKDLLSRSPALLRFAMDHISSLLKTGISHTQDYGEREVLLPLLHLLKECLVMMVDIDHQSIYKLLMPFYTWPAAHSETVKEVLSMLLLEKKARGTLYRRLMLQDHQLDLRLKTRPKSNTVAMLIDTSGQGNYGNKLYQAMIYHQEKPPTLLIKRLLLSSVFHSVPDSSSELDFSLVDNNICKLNEESLTVFCEEGIDIAEQAATMETMEESREFLKAETSDLYKKIVSNIQETSNGESENEMESFPTSFVLPPPYIPVYEIEQNHFSAMVDKLQSVLMRLQKTTDGPNYPSINVDSLMSYAPPTGGNLPSKMSQHSLASSGSYSIDEYPKSSTDVASLGEDKGLAQNGINRSVSPTVKSDPGTGLLIKSNTIGEPPLSPSSKKVGSSLVTKSLSMTNEESFGDLVSQDSDKDTTSDSGSKASEEVISRVSTDSSSTHPSGRKLERRYTTDSFGSRSSRNLSLRASGIYGPNQAVSPTASIGSVITSRGSVKQRANPSGSGTLRQRRANTVTGGAVLQRSRGKLRKVKIILAGNDLCLSNTVKAYAHLKTKEPSLFTSLDIEFLYIPLSKAVTGGIDRSPPSSSGSLDLPEPTSDNGGNGTGQDVMIGHYLAHMDSWYEQNVMLAFHDSLRLLLNDSNFIPKSYSMLEGLDTRWLPLPSPSRVVVNSTANFLREAVHPVKSKIFKVKMTLRSDKAAKGFENRECFMFHRIDIQKLGKKDHRPKPYEAGLALTELSLDNSFIKSDLVQMKDVWIIRGSNIPHPWDIGVPNPENECFELMIIKITSEGGRLSTTKHRVQEELQHHVYEMVVECGKEKPLSVIIDNDLSSITENVIRVEVSPAYIDQAVSGSSLRRTERQERQMDFPLVTFWPVDL